MNNAQQQHHQALLSDRRQNMGFEQLAGPQYHRETFADPNMQMPGAMAKKPAPFFGGGNV